MACQGWALQDRKKPAALAFDLVPSWSRHDSVELQARASVETKSQSRAETLQKAEPAWALSIFSRCSMMSLGTKERPWLLWTMGFRKGRKV